MPVENEIIKPITAAEILEKIESLSSDNHRKRTEDEEDKALLKLANEENRALRFEETPWYITGGKMRDYQVRGLNWMIQLYHSNTNGILADEMGLGKTLQTISMIGYIKYFAKKEGHYLIIVPKSTLQNWINEFNQWIPTFKVKFLMGDQDARSVIKKELHNEKWDVLVTTYEMCIIAKSIINKFQYEYLAIDEAHRIKNESSKLSLVVRTFSCVHRLLITGTPLQNNLHELWALLNFLMPDLFESSNDFDSMFNVESIEQENLVSRLHTILKPFLLRRMKMEVEKTLLPKKEIKVYIGLSKMQRELYTKILTKDFDALNGISKHVEKTRLQNMLMQLRKCTNHPYLFEGMEPGPPWTTDYHLVSNCGKMVLLDKLLTRLKAEGSRVLLFTQMTRVLDILEDYCRWRGHAYCRLDGDTAHSDRQASIDEYNAPNSSKFLFMLSTRAGGLGINLTSADVVIIYDSDWNPQVDLQAQDRAHRIGQTKQVRIFRLITENTVEERIIARADMKLKLDNIVIQQGRLVDSKSNNLQKNEMLDIIKYGANYIFRSKDLEVNDEDIEVLLSRGEEKTAALNKKLEEFGDNSLSQLKFDTTNDDGTVMSSLYNFEGENYRDKIVITNDIIDLIQPSKRDRRKTYVQCDAEYDHSPKKLFKGDIDEEFKVGDESEGSYCSNSNKVARITKKLFDFQFNSTNKTSGNKQVLADINERNELKNVSFINWSKKDFNAFIKANEKFGRDDVENISRNVAGKTCEEVKNYVAVFWNRFQEIEDFAKHIKKIERGEARIERTKILKRVLDDKVSQYTSPFTHLKIIYSNNKGEYYSAEEDRFLICMLHKLGINKTDVYHKLRIEINKSLQFRFNWIFKSRSIEDLQKRCNFLLSMIEKELNEKKKPKKVMRIPNMILPPANLRISLEVSENVVESKKEERLDEL